MLQLSVNTFSVHRANLMDALNIHRTAGWCSRHSQGLGNAAVILSRLQLLLGTPPGCQPSSGLSADRRTANAGSPSG
jgi:hypothetical protein